MRTVEMTSTKFRTGREPGHGDLAADEFPETAPVFARHVALECRDEGARRRRWRSAPRCGPTTDCAMIGTSA
jgi:hypothetical protein